MKGNVMGFLFLASCILLVGTAFLLLNKENSGAADAIASCNNLIKRIESISTQIEKSKWALQNAIVALEAQTKTTINNQGTEIVRIRQKAEMVEMLLDKHVKAGTFDPSKKVFQVDVVSTPLSREKEWKRKHPSPPELTK